MKGKKSESISSTHLKQEEGAKTGNAGGSKQKEGEKNNEGEKERHPATVSALRTNIYSRREAPKEGLHVRNQRKDAERRQTSLKGYTRKKKGETTAQGPQNHQTGRGL